MEANWRQCIKKKFFKPFFSSMSFPILFPNWTLFSSPQLLSQILMSDDYHSPKDLVSRLPLLPEAEEEEEGEGEESVALALHAANSDSSASSASSSLAAGGRRRRRRRRRRMLQSLNSSSARSVSKQKKKKTNSGLTISQIKLCNLQFPRFKL